MAYPPLNVPLRLTASLSAAAPSRSHATSDESERLSIAQIADRLDRSPATVKAYFYDPTGEKARAVKSRYVGVCRGCGAYTQPRNGKGDAYRYCKRCDPGAIQQRWTRELVIDAMLEWRSSYGRLPSSYDWSRWHANRRGGAALERLSDRGWPPASVAGKLFGGWQRAREAAEAASGKALLRGPFCERGGEGATSRYDELAVDVAEMPLDSLDG